MKKVTRQRVVLSMDPEVAFRITRYSEVTGSADFNAALRALLDIAGSPRPTVEEQAAFNERNALDEAPAEESAAQFEQVLDSYRGAIVAAAEFFRTMPFKIPSQEKCSCAKCETLRNSLEAFLRNVSALARQLGVARKDPTVN